ncbi:restriction endonuclease subunit S [Salmonella enterica]|uniref:restriction endonuclease subunit S n=1 Tax=Salmonella enterica TaxID=28901 RepID=UPI0026DCC5A8|nr:restriction endonuclease subunit S [Salmonella enterica]MDO3816282.1 restriction endonuclease subunit S [Salmonella enterica]MDO3825897.1 restriction endonuclease subunit S [Salmonella enterica]
MSGGKLPEGWGKTVIGDIADVISGGTPKSGIAENFAPSGEGIAWLTPADLSGYKKKFISHGARDLSTEGYSSCSAKLMPAGAILFSSRAPIGYVAVASNEISTNQGFKSFVFTNDIYPDYAYYYLRNIRHLAEEMGTGTTFKEISGSAAKTLPFVMAPLAEQKIIAEKLDTLLAQVDSTKARLEQIPQILKRFRQAILAAAISGKLTDKWRKLTDLQTIWKSHTLGELVTIDRGSSPRPIKDYITTDENGVNWIKIGDTKEGEKYIRSTKERITKEGSKKSRKVTPGDFILSNSMSLGRAYIVEIEGYVHDGWFILRLPENIDKNYFYYLLSSSQLQTQFSSLAVGGVVQNIRSELVKQAIVNIPPLSEQHEIVRRVEQLFAYADTIEKQVNNALTRVNSLTQSILAKAFRGELTAQWRAENPSLISGENSAAALLEKIKAERAASGGKKTSRKKA